MQAFTIYKISDGTKSYIGQTFQDLNVRFSLHKSAAKLPKNSKRMLYSYINSQATKWDNFNIIALMEVKVNLSHVKTKQMASKLERDFILADKEENKDNNLNKCLPLRTKEEGYELNHKTHTCECGGQYTMNNKPRHLRTEKHKKINSLKPIPQVQGL
jgi:hypothetical protein